MARLDNTILTGSFTEGYTAPMIDIRAPGLNGFAPDYTFWLSSQKYVAQNLIVLLMEAPTGFQYMPDPDFWTGGLKSLIETRAKSVNGLHGQIEVDWGETPISGGGQMLQYVTNVTRARSNPEFVWDELAGRPIGTYFEEYIGNLIADPDSKVPNIATLNGAIPSDLLADVSTFTTLFIEPDPLHRSVQKAWLCANMMPKTGGAHDGKRELSNSLDAPELSIEFSAFCTNNLGVRLLAQSILDNINFANANPNTAPAFISGIDADVAAADTGYAVGVETMGANAVAQRG
jgi:hypothetical protein